MEIPTPSSEGLVSLRQAKQAEESSAVSAAVEQMVGSGLTIAGRKFRVTTATTFEQDLFILSHMNESKLSEIARGFDPATDDVSQFAESVIVKAFQTGKIFLLLAGSLVEEGVEWTVEGAEQTAKFFSTLTDARDKQALHSSIMGILLSFFLKGESSVTISPKSFAGKRTNPATHGAGPRSSRASQSRSEGLRDGILVSGTASSAISRPTTPRKPKRS